MTCLVPRRGRHQLVTFKTVVGSEGAADRCHISGGQPHARSGGERHLMKDMAMNNESAISYLTVDGVLGILQ